MIAVIVCGGEIKSYGKYEQIFNNADFLICADSGARHLKKLKIVPHALIGDFDSISSNDYNYYKEKDVAIIKFPPNKNKTDTELAVDYAVERDCNVIYFLGALGLRIDHSLSNIFLLKKLIEKGIKGVILDNKNEITLIDDKIVLERENKRITFLSLSEETRGIKSKGLLYELNNDTLKMGNSMGVSNEFSGDIAEISIDSGLLLVIKSKD